ncbi:S-methyl-5-thioribose-1-phosphate isomerase [Picrophilus oshimae]|uniref:Putative methylthioribose-1-phosphate isomerase n=1 Tax=Picrophilus torridus (strain ATCC 700027 / DSM 9790 / JCM 10055 / NBRC 100828 / KAW 2/3) TaxID=1122961 RepID=Q6L2F6_PICTO|nr:S-methyl-5-thioribose-1-phosphate isomerase [Picrophilus oshimae]AAT42846.1 archaeal protein translation initiation factor 2B subunit 1 [Picrophilus oshimae DSM 9789]SMD31606.1 translation initiation factor 2B subunit I family (IF-2BI) [Picrophilus oshimae DSM 9789]
MKVNINGETKTVLAVWYEDNKVKLIDQRKIPDEISIIELKNSNDVYNAIRDMAVRGAPAIGVTAAYGLAMAKKNNEDMEKAVELIRSSRPTAYDLFKAIDYMKKNNFSESAARRYALEITERSKKIGEYGNELIKNGDRILTHCNAGALAVVDWGTAIAPMRIAKDSGKNIFVYVDETRPRLQGARLTAWELAQEGIDHSIIADNAAGYFMKKKDVNLVIVGADRIAANGDFANKIGTYEKAVLAKVNNIPFYVAAPGSTFDFNIKSGDEIPIEERDENEVLSINGKNIGPSQSHARNPAFDVTPNEYVTAFITEYGIFKPNELEKLRSLISKDLFMR